MFESYVGALGFSLIFSCGTPALDDETTPLDEPVVGTLEQSLGGTTTTGGGKGVVEIVKQDTAVCTGFVLNSYMIFTAAHCVDSGQLSGTANFKVRYTTNGTSWTCISGPTSSGQCSSWSSMSYYAGDNAPAWPVSTDWAIVYRSSPLSISAPVGLAPFVQPNFYQGWGRGLSSPGGGSGTMRYGADVADSVSALEFESIASGTSTPRYCEGDSGGPAFPNKGGSVYWQYAVGVASTITAPKGGVAGACAVNGDRQRFYRVTMATVNNVNHVANNLLGSSVCPYCSCTEMGGVYPGQGLDGFYLCDSF